jgi:Lrp/AsnC family leucine-responsive transcriptional regulator
MREETYPDRLDDLDRQLLERLQADGRLSNSRLAEEVGLSETPCWRRIKRLESDGFIAGYSANLDRRKLGLAIMAFVQVKFSTHHGDLAHDFERAIVELPQVLSCHNVAGEADYILQVVAKDLDDYGQFTNVLRDLPGVAALHSVLSLREVKKFAGIPIQHDEGARYVPS